MNNTSQKLTLIYVAIFHFFAPIGTLVFGIISFFNVPHWIQITFIIFAICYFIGRITSYVGERQQVTIFNKSLLERRHPFLNSLLKNISQFLPFIIVFLIVSLISKDFSYFLQFLIFGSWGLRLLLWWVRRRTA